MTRKARQWAGGAFGKALGSALLALAACSATPPPVDPPLTADPPLSDGPSAADGAVATEIQRGVAFVKNEKYAEAKEHFQKALDTKPNAEAAYYLGLCAEKLNDRAGAEASYNKALDIDAGFVEAALNLGALYLDEPANPDKAIAVLKKSLAKATDNVRLLQNLGLAYGIKGDIASAGEAYEQALKKGEDAQIRFAYGALLVDNKSYEKAAVQLKKALDGTKDDAPLLVTLGRLLGASKAFGDCVKAFDRAIKIKATDPEWYVRRGTCRHELKDEPGAQEDYQAAIKVDGKFAAAHYYLGLSLLGDKKRQLATISLEKAAKFGEGTPIGKVAREKLDSLAKKK